MSQLFKLKVNTPEGILFEDDILQADINTISGWQGILANHAPIIGAFNTSHLFVKDQKNNRVDIIISQGIFEFNNNVLNIFTNLFVFAKNFNQSAIKVQEDKLMEIIQQQKLNAQAKSYEYLQFKLKKNISELQKLVNNNPSK